VTASGENNVRSEATLADPTAIVCSVCGRDWMRGENHAIWCGGFGYPHGTPITLAEYASRLASDEEAQR
jgi:hypothetical protein